MAAVRPGRARADDEDLAALSHGRAEPSAALGVGEDAGEEEKGAQDQVGDPHPVVEQVDGEQPDEADAEEHGHGQGDDGDDDAEDHAARRHDGRADGLVVDRGHHRVDGVEALDGPAASVKLRFGHGARLVGGSVRSARHDVTDADGVGTGVGADHRAELDRHQWCSTADLADLGLDTASMSSQAPSATASRLERGVPRHLGRQVGQGTGAGALLGLLGHDAVLHLDHRLDREQRAEQGLGPADAAAALEVLEPAEDAVDADPADPVRGWRTRAARARLPPSASSAAAITMRPWPMVRERVSTTRTGSGGEGLGRGDGRGVGPRDARPRW